MNQVLRGSSADRAKSTEVFLSGAYRRILCITLALGIAAAAATTVLANWRSGLGLAVGAAVACLNFVWLHHGAEMMIQRMVEVERAGVATKPAPSTLRLLLAFTARYAFVMAAAYVILRGYPQVRLAFIVGLACPVIAAMGEGLYEAVRPQQTSND
jgi:hypothetical protein